MLNFSLLVDFITGTFNLLNNYLLEVIHLNNCVKKKIGPTFDAFLDRSLLPLKDRHTTFEGHTSDSIVRISLVIDRIINLHEEKGKY